MKKITRRQALGTTAGALTVLGLTAAAAGATSAAATPTEPTTPGTVDEVYKGRRIQITAGGGGHPGVPDVHLVLPGSAQQGLHAAARDHVG
ncbi:tyrosinase family oxidase copper chaperone, partial [Streptomyces virginiae]